MSSTTIPKVVPAQLSFLALYNPALGSSDETFHNQIVFYYSKSAKARSKADDKNTQLKAVLREEQHEKLRQVGLAQGMVGFARSFSNGEAVDSVETQKSRIVLHELENGWWILASIDLTRLPAAAATKKGDGGSKKPSEPAIEYSSREVSPPALLIHQLVRAHAVFLLHHGTTLESLYAKVGRDKFCNILDAYWSRFANNWDVLLHGSPAVDIYGALKLAAGGELGMGVGEEEWGSSERDVLEDYARRTEGLVDIMVSRFGEPAPSQFANSSKDSKSSADGTAPDPWLGSGRSVNAPDGVVFSGIGIVSRRSLRDVSQWVESIYSLGDYAYGVRDNPTTDRRKRRRKNPKPTADRFTSEALKMHAHGRQSPGPESGPGKPPPIPPPIVKAVESSLDRASNAVETTQSGDGNNTEQGSEPILASLADTETWMKYLTLGYGTAWGGRRTPDPDQPQKQDPVAKSEPSPEPMRFVEPAPDIDYTEEKRKTQIQQENDGYFLIGLKGDMEDADLDDENDEGNWNNRIPLRTVHVELSKDAPDIILSGDETPGYEKEMELASSQTRNLTRLRPVVYVHRPFIYTFLFHHRTPSLSMASFYRDLHTFFSPLHRSLDKNTSPDRVAARLSAASQPFTTTSSSAGVGPNTQPIYDLIFDPCTLTVHSSIPNIPDPGSLIAEGLSSTSLLSGWSRVEALSVHSQVLAAVADTRRNLSEIERTCKTSRGWWVVWMRLPPSKAEVPSDDAASADFNAEDLREAFLVRRARDAAPPSVKSSGSRFSSGMWGLSLGRGGQSERMGGAAAGWGPKGLAEGIGIDARRYVEELLSLNR